MKSAQFHTQLRRLAMGGCTALALLAMERIASAEEPITVGLIVKDLQVPFWLEMRKQAMEEAKAQNVTLIFEAGSLRGGQHDTGQRN